MALWNFSNATGTGETKPNNPSPQGPFNLSTPFSQRFTRIYDSAGAMIVWVTWSGNFKSLVYISTIYIYIYI